MCIPLPNEELGLTSFYQKILSGYVQMSAPLRLCFTLPCLFLAQSCSTASLQRDVAKNRSEIASETAQAATARRPELRLTWNQALARQETADPTLRAARERLAEVKRQRKNQWREWLPRPTLYVNFQNTFKNLGNFSSDDLNGAFIAPLTIPNPATQTARAYQLALTEIQSEAAYELSRRQQVISLYSFFSEWDRFSVENPGGFPPEELADAIRSRFQDRENSISDTERLFAQRNQFSRILNLPGTDVTPITKSLPRIDYASKYRKFTPGKNYGLLATQLYACDIQGALLRKKGLDLSRWPAPNFSTYTPSIYDSSRQDRQFLGDADKISLFGSWSKSFDLTGDQANEIRNAEENVRFIRENISVRIDSEGREWDRLSARYAALLAQRSLAQARLDKLTNGTPRISTIQEDILDARKLLSDLQNIERSKENLDLQLWLWDDSAW